MSSLDTSGLFAGAAAVGASVKAPQSSVDAGAAGAAGAAAAAVAGGQKQTRPSRQQPRKRAQPQERVQRAPLREHPQSPPNRRRL